MCRHRLYVVQNVSNTERPFRIGCRNCNATWKKGVGNPNYEREVNTQNQKDTNEVSKRG